MISLMVCRLSQQHLKLVKIETSQRATHYHYYWTLCAFVECLCHTFVREHTTTTTTTIIDLNWKCHIMIKLERECFNLSTFAPLLQVLAAAATAAISCPPTLRLCSQVESLSIDSTNRLSLSLQRFSLPYPILDTNAVDCSIGLLSITICLSWIASHSKGTIIRFEAN